MAGVAGWSHTRQQAARELANQAMDEREHGHAHHGQPYDIRARQPGRQRTSVPNATRNPERHQNGPKRMRLRYQQTKLHNVQLPNAAELETIRVYESALGGFGLYLDQIRKLMHQAGLVWLSVDHAERKIPLDPQCRRVRVPTVMPRVLRPQVNKE